MRIALLLSPFTNIYGKFQYIYRKGFLNPPLGFAYIAAAAEKHGHSVIIIDAESENIMIEDIISKVSEFSPDIIGYTVTSPTFDLTTEFAKKIKNTFPTVPTVVGGVHLAIFQKSVLEENPVYDFGIIGDGEEAVPELLSAIAKNGDFSTVKGLIWRKEGVVIQNEIRIPEKNLDKYPLPARHLLKNELYLRNVPHKGYVVSASVMASRGCPYDCIYCAVKKIPNGTMVRFRSPQNILDELTYIVKTLKITHIMFNDDCLTFRKVELLELCDLIKKSGLQFTWEGLSRADRVDRELLREMKSSGLIRLSFGIESGNQKILDVLQKHETLAEIRMGIQIAHEEGIITRGSVIVGSPYETSKEVEDTFRFINSIDELDEVVINIMQPYPGTKVRDMIVNGEGGTRMVQAEFSDLRRFGSASIEVNDLTADKLVSLQREGLKRFFCRPKKMIRLMMINHPFALVSDAIGAIRSLWG
nr:radical SAM protein [uncultured Methanoregula sp.]